MTFNRSHYIASTVLSSLLTILLFGLGGLLLHDTASVLFIILGGVGLLVTGFCLYKAYTYNTGYQPIPSPSVETHSNTRRMNDDEFKAYIEQQMRAVQQGIANVNQDIAETKRLNARVQEKIDSAIRKTDNAIKTTDETIKKVHRTNERLDILEKEMDHTERSINRVSQRLDDYKKSIGKTQDPLTQTDNQAPPSSTSSEDFRPMDSITTSPEPHQQLAPFDDELDNVQADMHVDHPLSTAPSSS